MAALQVFAGDCSTPRSKSAIIAVESQSKKKWPRLTQPSSLASKSDSWLKQIRVSQ
jgi:hypothetical protein